MNDDRTRSWPGRDPDTRVPGGLQALRTRPNRVQVPPRRPGPPRPRQPRPIPRPPGKGRTRRPKDVLTPQQRKKRRWRRVRRTLYVLFGLFVVVPGIAFVITYFAVSVPSPQSVAQTQGQAVTYLYADGSVMGKDAPSGGNRQILSADQIPDVVKNAAIATEDATFNTNSGFDVTGILRAAYHQITGGTGGGSTISQQYVKNASGNDAPTLSRKWTELAKSFKMNQTYTKSEIITAYLNIIYFGRGAYGIQAASQAFFHKDAAQLDYSEAALLAGLIQQPGRSENATVARDRWSTALDRMQKNGYITAAQRASAQFPTPIPLGDSQQGALNPFIKQQVKAELAAHGITEDKYYSGGFKVFTTIDPAAQKDAEEAVADGMAGQTDDQILNAMVAVDPKTGGVLAYYGGQPVVKGPNGEDQAGRDWAAVPHNPGSSMKPFDLAAFLKLGHGMFDTFDGTSPRTFPGVAAPIRNAGPSSSCSQQCTVAEAMQRSVNTVFYDMVLNVTKPAGVAAAAQEAGLRSKTDGGSDVLFTGDNNISIGGGQTVVTAADMASAYATFAADGVQHDRHFVSKVVNAQDESAFQDDDQQGTDAFADGDASKSAQIAGNVTAALQPVIPFSHLSCPAGHACAGKTGTQQHTVQPGDPSWAVNANSQTWMAGYTPSVSAAVWVGSDGDKALHGAGTTPLFGSSIAGPVWQKFMQLYLADKPPEQFDQVALIGPPPPQQQQQQQQDQNQQQDNQNQQLGQDDQNQNGGFGNGGQQFTFPGQNGNGNNGNGNGKGKGKHHGIGPG